MTGKKRKNNRLWVMLLCAAVIIVAVIFAVCQILLPKEGGDGGEDSAEPVSSADLIWQGKEYKYNDHLSNFLFIGVDNTEKEATQTGQANAGQADALYLLSWDRVEKSLTVISIPRDTIASIETFGPGGTSLGETEDHISLSYAYGDGGHESCRLTEDAVSGLFYGLSIQGYCSLNLEAIPVLTESVGSVDITVPNDSLVSVDPRFQAGAKVTLSADDTETFVRYRDTGEDQSAIARMERQQAYISGFGQAAKQAYAENPGFITDLYTKLEPYMVTNMGTDIFAEIMGSMSDGTAAESWTVPGEGVQNGSYDEYRVDDESLYAKIIETFYREV